MNYHHSNRNTAHEVSTDFIGLLWSWLQERCDDGARRVVNVYKIHSNCAAHNTGITQPNGQRTHLSHDDNQRLTQAQQSPLGNRNYTLDANGNRTADDGGAWSYNDNNQLLSSPGATYSYDSNGNLTRKTQGSAVTHYAYDHNNRLTHVEDGNGNTIANYGYDPFGRRLWKEVNGIKTYYFYSDEGLVAEYGQTGTQLVSYGYKPDSPWGTNPLYLRNDSGFYFYHNDHLGTPFKLTAVDGSVVWSAAYDAFGKAQVDAASIITSNLRFPGQYLDQETGLHYNLNRYYSPSDGRYTTSDPIGLAGGLNPYTYVDNNPPNRLLKNYFRNPKVKFSGVSLPFLDIRSSILERLTRPCFFRQMGSSSFSTAC